MNVKREKKRDNIKARMNITLFYDRQNIKLLNDEVRVTKPKTTFFLDKKHDLLSMNGLRVCDFLIDMLEHS
jgi:hypothetical protein